MNVENVKEYIKKENSMKFQNIINFKNVNFASSKYNGVIVDLEDGIHTLRIGNNVTKPQIQRVIILMMLDIAFECQNEKDRKYVEYGDKVAKVQADYYPVKDVFYEFEGVISKDRVLDCDESTCTLEKHGKVDRKKVIGLSYTESYFKNLKASL